MDRAWIVAVCVALVSAAMVLIFAPAHSLEKLGALVDRLPPASQIAILIGAVASAVAMLRDKRGKGPPSLPPGGES